MSDDLETMMQENAWRSALLGLCVGDSTSHLTPAAAFDNVRARITFAAASGKLPMGYKLETLASVMAKSYEKAAARDGFHDETLEGFTPEQLAFHEKWMLTAIKDMMEIRSE